MKKIILSSFLAAFLLGFGGIILADTGATASTGDTEEVKAELTTTSTGDANEAKTENDTGAIASTGDAQEVKAETETGAVASTGDTQEVKAEEATTITGDAKEAKAEEKTELEQAYEFAFEKSITTMDSIEKADMNGGLTRIAMAKMLSQYAINILGKKPQNISGGNFKDVTKALDDQYNNGVTLAYQLGIMGIGIENFRPFDMVTRAEFATALSRLLYGTKDGDPYYTTHLAKLKEEGIITNDDPKLQEVRGYVMIMLMRSSKNTAEPEKEIIAGVANPASVYCVEQGGEIEIKEDKDRGQYGICKLKDGTEVEEWEYYRANHKAEESTGDVAEATTGALFTEEDLAAAEKAINEEGFGKLTVKVENIKLTYGGDEKAKTELSYCKELDATIEECVVFFSEFYIPEQDAEMAGAFEPNKTLKDYQWYLGRTKGGEWKILTQGY